MSTLIQAKDLALVAIHRLEEDAERESTAQALTVLRLQVDLFDTLLKQ